MKTKRIQSLDTTIARLFKEIQQYGEDEAMYGSWGPEQIIYHEENRKRRRARLIERLHNLAGSALDGLNQ